ncbi:hypothetical protein [Pyrobaculum ferrireducens]|uniref:Uncharacterized protein n=1 Tax=Pyrobaculum ferrireducens TaxID=1104324 RepID=G7VID3_9CREN|nr:hypothetical protein [Pyrobaculum ferrireducens]AET33413.1 hypothetical protein P186_2017 [Pyrobaculum ferrireducens]
MDIDKIILMIFINILALGLLYKFKDRELDSTLEFHLSYYQRYINMLAILIASLMLFFRLINTSALGIMLISFIAMILAIMSEDKFFLTAMLIILLSSPLGILSKYGFSIIGYDEGRFWGFASLIGQTGHYSISFSIYESEYYRTFGVIAFLNYLLKEIANLPMNRVDNYYIILLNLLIFLFTYIILRHMKIDKLTMGIVLSSLFYQQTALPVINFIPQTLSYAFLLEILLILYLGLSKYRLETSAIILIVSITSAVTHPTVPLVFIFVLTYSTIISLIFYKIRKGIKMNEFIVQNMVIIILTALIYWIYSVALYAMYGGGIFTVSDFLSSLIKILFQGKNIVETFKSSTVWLGEEPSFAFYTETLLIASVIFSLFQCIIDLSYNRYNYYRNSYDYIMDGIILTILTYYSLVFLSPMMRRYFYTAFLLSPIILGYVFNQNRKGPKISKRNVLNLNNKKKMLIVSLLSVGIIAGITFLTGTFLASEYIPFPSSTDWLIAENIFYLLSNKTAFYIKYTDPRLAVPLSYYQLSYLLKTPNRLSMLIGIKFDRLGQRFIDLYLLDNYKIILMNKTYDLIGMWGSYYIILIR